MFKDHQWLEPPVALTTILSLPVIASAQHSMPADTTHDEHLTQLDAALEARGRQAMGFDQDATTHHFLLRPDGGVISVEIRVAADGANRQAIRTHLRRIASDFAAGRFDTPLAIHAEEPTGTSTLRAKARSIRYTVEDSPGGARVRIVSTDRQAIAAVHEFLRYQIRAHRTGDPLR